VQRKRGAESRYQAVEDRKTADDSTPSAALLVDDYEAFTFGFLHTDGCISFDRGDAERVRMGYLAGLRVGRPFSHVALYMSDAVVRAACIRTTILPAPSHTLTLQRARLNVRFCQSNPSALLALKKAWGWDGIAALRFMEGPTHTGRAHDGHSEHQLVLGDDRTGVGGGGGAGPLDWEPQRSGNRLFLRNGVHWQRAGKWPLTPIQLSTPAYIQGPIQLGLLNLLHEALIVKRHQV
jgi:hypothetical protein